MKILNSYYQVVGNQDVLGLAQRMGVRIEWVVEAGCHDGTDTLLINAALTPEKIFAFEPDLVSFMRAQELFINNLKNVTLFPFGLSSENGELFFNFPNNEEGTGSTMLSTEGYHSVQVKRFDDVVAGLENGGLLWLDVEGHATKVLEGASQMLPLLSMAKIEIQMHGMNQIRSSDFLEVSRIMKGAGLLPLFAPIHPGYFGDIIFVNRKLLSKMSVLYSKFLSLEMLALHKVVYPLLRKPKKFSA